MLDAKKNYNDEANLILVKV